MPALAPAQAPVLPFDGNLSFTTVPRAYCPGRNSDAFTGVPRNECARLCLLKPTCRVRGGRGVCIFGAVLKARCSIFHRRVAVV